MDLILALVEHLLVELYSGSTDRMTIGSNRRFLGAGNQLDTSFLAARARPLEAACDGDTVTVTVTVTRKLSNKATIVILRGSERSFTELSQSFALQRVEGIVEFDAALVLRSEEEVAEYEKSEETVERGKQCQRRNESSEIAEAIKGECGNAKRPEKGTNTDLAEQQPQHRVDGRRQHRVDDRRRRTVDSTQWTTTQSGFDGLTAAKKNQGLCGEELHGSNLMKWAVLTGLVLGY
ncbi:hypothetical protein V8G54_013573 [Vigna mungo]|uniref:Uncharacterized protein n=1 Tax=Vigna mungo TaxID=3915 RepID=A0AAQ3S3D9_VIGMU